jgi:hypothetical protein
VAVEEALSALRAAEVTGGELAKAQFDRMSRALDRARRHLG